MTEISLALGGGGIRGLAHIGVIRQLEYYGFTIKAISGTSAGGIIGAVYAAGYTTDEIQGLFSEIDKSRLFTHSSHDEPSLLGLQGFNDLLLNALGDRTFSELTIPFACTAVDINTCQEIIMASDNVTEAVMATIAVPGIFPPRKIGNLLLMDGAVLDPVPVALARWLSPGIPVIAVCLSAEQEDWTTPKTNIPNIPFVPSVLQDQLSRLRLGQAFKIFSQSIDISSRMLAELRMQSEKPNFIFRPDLGDYGILDDVDPKLLVKIGEDCVNQSIKSLRKSLSIKNIWTQHFG